MLGIKEQLHHTQICNLCAMTRSQAGNAEAWLLRFIRIVIAYDSTAPSLLHILLLSTDQTDMFKQPRPHSNIPTAFTRSERTIKWRLIFCAIHLKALQKTVIAPILRAGRWSITVKVNKRKLTNVIKWMPIASLIENVCTHLLRMHALSYAGCVHQFFLRKYPPRRRRYRSNLSSGTRWRTHRADRISGRHFHIFTQSPIKKKRL